MSEKLPTLREACRRLGVHPNTLRKWDRQGKISVVRTIGGRRRIPESKVERLMGFVKPDVSGKAVIYVRVSSHDQKQKGDLERQKQSLLNYAKSKGYEVTAVLEDIASGLNEKRESLSKLFDLVEERRMRYMDYPSHYIYTAITMALGIYKSYRRLSRKRKHIKPPSIEELKPSCLMIHTSSGLAGEALESLHIRGTSQYPSSSMNILRNSEDGRLRVQE